MFRFAIRLLVLIGLIVGSVVVLAAPDEPEAVANAGWEEMGVGSASGGGISNDSSAWNTDPALAIGPDGAPVVACEHYLYPNVDIYVRRWNGTAWIKMGDGSASGGGINDNDGDSRSPSVAIGSDGTSVVAWTDNSGGNWEIYVRRWNGSAWVEMAGGSASDGGISDSEGDSDSPSVAIGPVGPVVAWTDNSGGNREIYVRCLNGSAWVEMSSGSASGGGISNNHGDSSYPSVAIGADGAPVVAWMDNSNGNYDIYVRQWNGAAWVEMGSGSALGSGISNSLSEAKYPSLAIGPDGTPIVAWMDYSRGWAVPEIYVRRWNGSAWVEMGNGSASEGGISNTVGASEYPSLAIGPDNTPIVTWRDNSLDSEDYEIYVRRWNGMNWVEMDSGSASGGGISNDAGTSWQPSLAIGSDGTPFVTWMGAVIYLTGSTRFEIYVRRYQLCMPSWQNHNSQQSYPGIIPSASLQTLFLPSVLRERPPYFAGPAEFEPNNNQNEATGLLCSGYEYTGLPNDRYDIFSLEAASGLVIVNLTNHLPSGVQLQLHHQTITTNPIALDVNGADGYRVEVPNAPTGRYYVVISTLAPDPDATTRYQLTTSFNMSR